MLLALLMLVAGRLGGPVGGPVALAPALEPDRAIGGAPPRTGGAANEPSMGFEAERAPGGGGVPAKGGGVPLTERGAAFGGGGVGLGASVCSAPGALLIHRLSSGSYTKLFASPSLARMAFLAGSAESAFLPPPNHPLKPHPFFSACCSAARFSSSAAIFLTSSAFSLSISALVFFGAVCGGAD